MSPAFVKNIITVDLEDWFVVENLKDVISFEQWNELPSRVEDTTTNLLNLFDDYDIQATFFTLGWIAKKFPSLIHKVASMGHEIACHSFHHNRIDLMNENEFREDTISAMRAIKNACGVTPVGYRAPSWSLNSKVSWAFEVLADLGFMYDSSIFPIKHDIYGEPGGPKKIFKMTLNGGKSLYEIPASTVAFMGKEFPIGGGGYLRHSPLWFTRRMIKKINNNGQPVVLYIHPWEIDNNQPRLNNLSSLQRYRQYGSIATLQRKMKILLQEFDFCAARDYIEALKRKPIGFGR